jgi:ubiquitin carboxyl-terminal hydrolase 9/13
VYPYHLRMFNTTDDAEDPDRLYELYAVVVHIGGNAYHGHYVSIIKTQDRGWLLFDDELVEPVDKHYVRNFFGDKPGMACAYVLFYRETTPEAVQAEQDDEGAAEVALAEAEADSAKAEIVPRNGVVPSSISKQVTVPGLTGPKESDLAPVPVPLAHAATAPAIPSPPANHALDNGFMGNTSPQALRRTETFKSKEEQKREKKEAQEAEKARQKKRRSGSASWARLLAPQRRIMEPLLGRASVETIVGVRASETRALWAG